MFLRSAALRKTTAVPMAVVVSIIVVWIAGPATSAVAAWHVVPSPNPEHIVNSLSGVVRFSASDAWAVGATTRRGYNQTFGRTDPLVERLDGSTWQLAATPHMHRWAALSAVAASSPSDIWAVGTRGGPDRTLRSLIEHYDGSAWTIVPSPSPGQIVYLTGVSASGPKDAWAIGMVTDAGDNVREALAEHWDGTAWTVVATPDTGSPYTYLNDIEQTSPTDAWLVGSYWVPEASRPLAEHWNGKRWNIVKPPRKGPQDELTSVSATSPTDVWAVGGSNSDPSGMIPLAYHWDGTTWTLTSVPNPLHGIILAAVAAVSPTDVWAYGDYGLRRAHPAYEHWNGTSWRMIDAPEPSRFSLIYDIAAGPDGAFAVGEYWPSIWSNKTRTLIEECCA